MRRLMALLCLLSQIHTPGHAGGFQWVPNEGGPYGGNITDILQLPDRTLASGQGTMYEAVISPVAWTGARLGLPANQLLFDPGRDNTGTYYAAIDGIGVVRSATGAMWGTVNAGLVNLNVKTLSVRDSLLLAGNGAGLFTASSGVTQWDTLAFSGSLVLKVEYKPGGPIFAALPSSGMQRYSGGNWTPVNNGLSDFNWTSLGVSPVNDEVAACTDQHVYLSTNNGDIWNTPLTGAGYSAVRFNLAGALYVGAGSIIKRSTDQGASFQDLPDLGPGRVNSIAFDNANTLWVAHSMRGALEYAGTDWQERNQGITSFTVQGMAGDDAALVATSEGGYIRNNDRGPVTYSRVVRDATPFKRNFLSAYIENPRAAGAASGSSPMYFGTQDGFLRSTDGGATWTPANNGLVSTTIWDIVVKDSLMFVATYNGIYRSTNRGDSWVQANSGNTTLTSGLVIQRSTGHLFALASGVSRSTDNGVNWNTVYLTPGFATATGMDFAPNGNMYAGVFNNGVARSTDNGASWEMLRNGLEDWSVRDVKVNAQGVVYAGTASGVFHSTNNGDSWSLLGSGLEAPVVTALYLDAQGYLFAGTMGGGVFRSAQVTGVDSREIGVPAGTLLSQNYPNPFNPATTITFTLERRMDVTLSIFNSAGQLVRTLARDTFAPGSHAITWDGRSDGGERVSSGVYFYQTTLNDRAAMRKMILLK